MMKNTVAWTQICLIRFCSVEATVITKTELFEKEAFWKRISVEVDQVIDKHVGWLLYGPTIEKPLAVL